LSASAAAAVEPVHLFPADAWVAAGSPKLPLSEEGRIRMARLLGFEVANLPALLDPLVPEFANLPAALDPLAPIAENLPAGESPNVAGAVPEPGTWALLIAGFGLVGWAARRRARSLA
ncbi:MAG: PEPxxWA-CTERM sorting domain-containing protein, partial [Sphingomonadaceae bacterium]